MATLNYIVLSCQDLLATKRFYETLGLTFQEEKHGTGPAHFSTTLSGIVIELYPAKTKDIDLPGPRRMGITVEDIEHVFIELGALGTTFVNGCAIDPDGRTIEILKG